MEDNKELEVMVAQKIEQLERQMALIQAGHEEELTRSKRKSFAFGAAAGAVATFAGLSIIGAIGGDDDDDYVDYYEVIED